MSRRGTGLVKAALSALHYSGVDRLSAPYTSGAGVIFMLHHVVPGTPGSFEPNRILKVTPEFLESLIVKVRASGFDIISLDEVKDRLQAGDDRRPFAVFTLDDGYRDNRDYAYPIFRHHQAPFTIYVPTAYADGHGDLWWLVLEESLRRLTSASMEIAGETCEFDLATDDQKQQAYHAIYWRLRRLPEKDARAKVAELAVTAQVDGEALCRTLVMNWDEIRALAEDPLVTIGAHTVNHLALGKLDYEDALREMFDSVQRIEKELGRPCRHFSYPYGCEASAGDREFEMARLLGLETAVTTRKGLVRKSHRAAMVALPRLSLNGDYQDARYVDVLLSGLPFALRDGVKKAVAPLKWAARATRRRVAASI